MKREVPTLPYLAAWGASLSALLAAATVLPWVLPSVGLLVVNSVAVPLSMWMRSRGVGKPKASAISVILAGLFLLLCLKFLPVLPAFASGILSLSAYQALQLIVFLFSLFLAFRNFSLVTDFDLTATIVPATAILLLVAILSPELYFAAFLFPAMLSFAILLAHEQRRLLSYRAVEVAPKAERKETGWGEAKGPALIGVVSVVIAFLLARFEVKLNLLPLVPADFQMRMVEFISSILVRAGRTPYGCIEPVLDMASNPAILTDEVLFLVESERPAYWRGTAFEIYTGRWWTKPPVRRRKVPAQDGRAVFPSMDEDVRRGKFVLLRQRFKVVRPLMGGLFAAYEPWVASVPGARKFFIRPDGTVSFSVILSPGESYEVISRVPKRDPEELRRSSRRVPPPIGRVCLQLPPDLPRRVCELAWKVAGDAPNWFDAAKRIESFLKRNYKGALERIVPPPGRDFVDYFLFESRRGFCVHFASAMVVMLRCLGIPARVAAGFAPGVYEGRIKAFLVRESDAHAWVEVYFPGHGWVAFDPTPEDVVGGPRGWGSRLKLFLFSAGQSLKERWRRFRRWTENVSWGKMLLVALGALAATLLGWRLGRARALPLPARALRRGKGRSEPAVEAYRAMLSLLSRRGLGRMPHETPYEHLARVEGRLGGAAPPARKLAEFYVETVYGGYRIDPKEVERALKGMRSALRRKGENPGPRRDERDAMPEVRSGNEGT